MQQEDDSDDIVINEQAPHKKRAAKQVGRAGPGCPAHSTAWGGCPCPHPQQNVPLVLTQVPKTQSLEAVLSGAAGDAPARKRKAPVPAHLDAGQLSLLGAYQLLRPALTEQGSPSSKAVLAWGCQAALTVSVAQGTGGVCS